MKNRMSASKVYLVGAGPGDADLITVKGMEILRQADVIVYDYLVDRELIRCAAFANEIICADSLGGKRYDDGFTTRQDLINNLLMKKAKEGKGVVRLKNGDPFIFGRSSEEMDALSKAGIEFAVVPGVSAANAAACFSGIPLTQRGVSSNVIFVTGQESTEKRQFIDWKKIAKADTIVLYMAVENLSYITRKLIDSGRREDTPVAVIQNVSKISQKLLRGILGDISLKAKEISAPAIVIVGDVVKNAVKFNWFKKSKKILFTGLSKKRYFEDGLIFHLPLIEIKPLAKYSGMDKILKRIEDFNWIVFSSRYGVFYFFQRLYKLNKDSRNLNEIRIAAIGRSTADELMKYGILANLVPENECSAGLLSEFGKLDINGSRIFLPRSDIADKGLEEGLVKQGAYVASCFAYRNIMPEELPDIDFNFFDEIIFTSPSTVRNFKKRYETAPENVKIRCIGEVTKKEVKKHFGNRL